MRDVHGRDSLVKIEIATKFLYLLSSLDINSLFYAL